MTEEEPIEMRYMEVVEDHDAPKCACGKTATYYMLGQKYFLNLCEKCYAEAVKKAIKEKK